MTCFKKALRYMVCFAFFCLLIITSHTEYSGAFTDTDGNSHQGFSPLTSNAWNLFDETSLIPEDFNLTVSEASDCSQTLKATAQQGYITIRDLVGVTDYRCDIDIKVKEDMLVHLQWIAFNEPSCGYCWYQAVDQGRKGQVLMSSCLQTEIRDVLSFTNQVRVNLEHVSFNQEHFSCFMTVKFTAVLASEKQKLCLNYSSPYQGYIQTPGWDRKARYPPLMDSWVTLQVPEGHTVMVSWTSIDVSKSKNNFICRDSLQIFAGGSLPGNLVLEFCHIHTEFGAINFNTSMVYVHFLSDFVFDLEFTGFRLLFNFHNHTSLPEQLSDDKWNCSVSHWPEFQHNFPCDLVSQCVGGEDEATCPYISDFCEPGQVRSGDMCYLYVPHVQTDWWGAENVCLQRGMRLPILNSPEKFSSVASLLDRPRPLIIFLGLQIAAASLPIMYSRAVRWVDGTQLYYRTVRIDNERIPACAHMILDGWIIIIQECEKDAFNYDTDILCEHDHNKENSVFVENLSLLSQRFNSSLNTISLQMCPQNHVVHSYMSCDVKSACFVQDGVSSLSCLAKLNSSQKFFACSNGFQHIPFTMVCNHFSDCSDKSDEDFCVFPGCSFENPFTCGNQQCVTSERLCDGSQDCANGGDEMCLNTVITRTEYALPSPPVIIDLNSNGKLEVFPLTLNRTDADSPVPCPETHFKCPGTSVFCMPVFLRCNGVNDCPGKEDEARCDSYLCPGFYRCRDSKVCVHPSNVCDGFHLCPQQDDEMLCDLTCPDNCTCHGLSFICTGPFPAEMFPDLRYLDATGAGMMPKDLKTNRLLIYLSFARCDLHSLGTMTLPNLQSLDLTDNFISFLYESDFILLSNLRKLVLSGNPLSVFFTSYAPWKTSLLSVRIVDMSKVAMRSTDGRIIENLFPAVEHLNLSGTGLQETQAEGFGFLKGLKTLDIRGCPLATFPNGLLRELHKLESVQADDYRLCCQQLLPEGFNLINCHAPADEISSCDALLGSKTHKVFWSLYCSITLAANALCLVYRYLCLTHARPIDIFQLNLCVANLLMGVYLAIINIADRSFQNSFVWFDREWRQSILCTAAGLIAWLSNLAGLFFILLITIERLLESLAPGTRYSFQKSSAWGVSSVAWLLGLLWSLVFVCSRGQNWTLTDKASICIPLPLSPTTQAGYEYFLKSIIVPTFVISFVTGVGQLATWFLIRNENQIEALFNEETPIADTRQTLNLTAFNVVCFTLISGLGILSACGMTFPMELNAGLAIYVIPLSSALNPVIFAFHLVQRRHRQKIHLRLMQRLMLRVTK